MLLTDKEREALVRIQEFEKTLPNNAFDVTSETVIGGKGQYQLGWEWRDVKVHAAVLNGLVIKGCLETLFHSNSYTGYRLSEEGKELLLKEAEEITNNDEYSGKLEIPNDLFSVITGYSEIKEMFLRSFKGEPVDFLMIGVPGSAKTMFLSELERIPGSTSTVLGGTASKVGIIDILFDYRPIILLLDEFEHLNTKDYTVLLSLCETRIISETKHGKTRRMVLNNTRVFAGCNSTKNIPIAILDRMQKVTFRNYSYSEFVLVVKNVLTLRMGMMEEISEYIAEKTWKLNHSVRQAIRIAKMAKTKKEVDELLEVMLKYSS